MKLLSLIIFLFGNVVYSQSCFLKPADLNIEKFDYIEERFQPPAGFIRIPTDSNSFAYWLRQMPLLSENSSVKDYKNRMFKKSNDSTVAAVVAYNIKGRKLEQCMDILLKFWTEYLINQNKRNEIIFPLPDGLMLSWTDWENGMRPKFRGLNFYLENTAKPDSSNLSLKKYLNTIFEYSSTQAFYHYYKDINPADLQIGDFVVKKGYKGHAMMIVDLAQDKDGNLQALIGQGDTPACQFYLLNYEMENPWFPIDISIDVLPLPIKKEMRWKGLRRF